MCCVYQIEAINNVWAVQTPVFQLWLRPLKNSDSIYIFVNFVYYLNDQCKNWKYLKIYQGHNTNCIFNLFCWIDFVVQTVQF